MLIQVIKRAIKYFIQQTYNRYTSKYCTVVCHTTYSNWPSLLIVLLQKNIYCHPFLCCNGCVSGDDDMRDEWEQHKRILTAVIISQLVYMYITCINTN